jgi:ATP-dependent Clp protease ATP-binding subunit ClpA
MREQVLRALRRQFRPEFLNRVDEIVVFRALTEAELARIVAIQLDGLRRGLRAADRSWRSSEAPKAYLARVGYDPSFGARRSSVRSASRSRPRLRGCIVAGKVEDGGTVRVDVGRRRAPDRSGHENLRWNFHRAASSWRLMRCRGDRRAQSGSITVAVKSWWSVSAWGRSVRAR